MDERRTSRVSQAVREELAELIGFETADPRLHLIDVLDAQVSPDGKHASVRVTVRGNEKETQEALKALEGAGNYLRHQLAVRFSLRHVPELHFDH